MRSLPCELFSTAQQQDINTSEAPGGVCDWARIKTYVKPSEIASGWTCNQRTLSFDQPYQWASHITGDPWEVTNRAFLVQVPECNLSCSYCFLGDTPEGGRPSIDVPTNDIIAAFHHARMTPQKPGVLRISGGEPLLYDGWQRAIAEIIRASIYPVWIDTNGTRGLGHDLRATLEEWTGLAAVCLCFKPGDADIETQLSNAKEIYRTGCLLFYYWPSVDGDAVDVDHHTALLVRTMDALRQFDPMGPLRLTVLRINRYEANAERLALSDADLGAMFRDRRRIHRIYLERNYTAAQIWQPSHLCREVR